MTGRSTSQRQLLARLDHRGVRCPVCNGTFTYVMDRRDHAGNTLRNRRCREGHTFATAEYVIDETPFKIIMNGAPFSAVVDA